MTTSNPLRIVISITNGQPVLDWTGWGLLFGVDPEQIVEFAGGGLAGWPVRTLSLPGEWATQYEQRTQEAVAQTGIDTYESVLRYWARKDLGVDDIELVVEHQLPSN